MTTNEDNIIKYYDLFEITNIYDIDEEYLHKKYKKLALNLHPDKGGTTEKFQELQEGYDTLLLLYKINNENKNSDNMNVIMQYIHKFQTKYQEPLNKLLSIFDKNFSNFSMSYLETLDCNNLYCLYLFLQQDSFKNLVSNDIIKNIENLLEKKKNRHCIFKKVTLSDIFEKNIFKFQYKNEIFFAPMWHSEVEFETNDNEEFCVHFIPILPDNVWIDENNDLCIYLKLNLDNTLLLNEIIPITIESYTFEIQCSQIVCIKNQLIKIKNQGLWKILQNDMFNVQEKGDIIIHLELE